MAEVYRYKSSDWDILEAMKKYGGSFVRKLAELYKLADLDNRRILENAFRKYFIRYDEIARHEEKPE